MKYTDNALNILTTLLYRGIGKAWVHKNILATDCLESIVEKIAVKYPTATEEDFKQKRDFIEQKILALGESCDGLVALHDSKFPVYRGKVTDGDKPIALFYKGDLSLLSKNNTNIAVIGLLNPDDVTEQDERAIVDELVKQNVVIVSGLAKGCDEIAHRQTLQSGGLTLAILPSPLNNIQPAANKQLAEEIVENGGLLVTEYLTTPTDQRKIISRYIERDRLQALYSDCVLLSASYAQNDQGNDSGARHALEKAKKYGLLQAVIYDNIHRSNPKYDLNRQIIQEQPKPIVIQPNNMRQDINELLQAIKKNNQSLKYTTPAVQGGLL
ncbi:DNA-protecting protein DprA [Moraxella nasovis]|uniref:DNA-processing protein DprA n=1 Tax=Moraxella nasovis TaxID=2904121 RepID=UPI001F60AE93|nr:DNA-processing protein DprA [Moraxella nasovis]UNU73168.1 DNA-protecting protein DprA [Moraxella nasovis]